MAVELLITAALNVVQCVIHNLHQHISFYSNDLFQGRRTEDDRSQVINTAGQRGLLIWRRFLS